MGSLLHACVLAPLCLSPGGWAKLLPTVLGRCKRAYGTVTHACTYLGWQSAWSKLRDTRQLSKLPFKDCKAVPCTNRCWHVYEIQSPDGSSYALCLTCNAACR